MIERIVKIKNFRNIGNGEYCKLELNAINTKEQKMGGLVTLIGANNSGKSNILDALLFLSNKKLLETDYPAYDFSGEDNTVVSLWIKEGVNEYNYRVKNGSFLVEKYEKEKPVDVTITDTESNLNDKIANEDFDKLLFYFNHGHSMSHIGTSSRDFQELVNKTSTSQATEQQIIKLVEILSRSEIRSIYLTNIQNFTHEAYTLLIDKLKKLVKPDKNKIVIDAISKEVKENYNINLIPKIIKYDDSTIIKAKDIVSNVVEGKIDNSAFIRTICKLLKKIEYEEIEKIYEKLYKSNGLHMHLIENLSTKINKELVRLSEIFNQVYGTTLDQKLRYDFHIRLESNKIAFIIKQGGSAIPFDQQSTGFKWFFNFFFKIFADDKLENGDIVILDEPATNLHVKGQIELRNQLHRFGLENGITFVISTHSPFLVDPDYLDHIRIVQKDDLYTKIENKFTVIDEHKEDVLLPIHTALTVDRHIILNPNETIVFVEGITDYNYLVAFKHKLNIEGLRFLPVQGLKNQNLVSKLLKIYKNPILLIDSDDAGKKFAQKYGDTKIELISLSDADLKFQTIESLFSKNDQSYYCNDKNYKLSSCFKEGILHVKLEDETTQNFHKLFEVLMK